MQRYSSYCEDFYCNIMLNTEMELNTNRESTLHFFEQLRKRFPMLKNFYSRARHEYVLEEDKEQGNYRWASCERNRLCSGLVNPGSVDEAFEQHACVLELAPYSLGVSPLDCESMNVVYGFDFTFRGNHSQLIADTLGLPPAYEALSHCGTPAVIAYEPAFQFSLDESCRTQCRVSVESRSHAFHVRRGEFPEEQLSVYVTVRRYGSLAPEETFVDVVRGLREHTENIVDRFVVDQVLVPLQQSIATQ